MIWNGILAFALQRCPDLERSLRGVAPEHIERLESSRRITLPRGYVRFLETMGRSSGEFHPFGPRQIHRFPDLLQALSPDDHSPERYFRVAIHDDPSTISSYDRFLDLARGNGEDAPLVMFESGVEVSPGDIIDEHSTFLERMARAVFAHFDLTTRAVHATIRVPNLVPARGRELAGIARELLMRSGAGPAMPVLSRVACLRRADLGCLVEVHEATRLLSITVGSEDSRVLESTTAEILTGIPGAVRVGADGRLRARGRRRGKR